MSVACGNVDVLGRRRSFAVLTVEIETRLIGHYLSAMEASGNRKTIVHEVQKKDVDKTAAMKRKLPSESVLDGACNEPNLYIKRLEINSYQRQHRRTQELLGKRSGIASICENGKHQRLRLFGL